MVEYEYVFDETVSRRFVRRYHFSGAETIFPLAPCKTNLVPPDQAGGPRRRHTKKENAHTDKAATRGWRDEESLEKKFRKRECMKKKKCIKTTLVERTTFKNSACV